MRNHIIAILLIMSTLFGASGATPQFVTPDFAYPQKVAENARKNLDSGLNPLRCLLELSVAERAIDPDTIFTLPGLVESNMAKAKTDADRAMLTAFEAEIFASIYKADSWKYNKVDAPLLPLPEDISKWSSEQFAHKLNELYGKALSLAKADNRPLSEYKDAIEYGKESLDYIPDIHSFILCRKVDNFVRFGKLEDSYTNALREDCEKMATAYPAGSYPAVYWACRQIALGKSDDFSKEYIELYKTNEGKPGAPYALSSALDRGFRTYEPEANATDDEHKAEIASRNSMISLLEKAIATYPGYYQIAMFKNRLKSLTDPTMAYSIPAMTCPGSEIGVKVRYAFTKSVGFGLYKLSDSDTNLSGSKIASTMPCVAKKTISTTATDGCDTLKFTFSEPGNYALVPILNGMVQNNADATVVICSPFVPVNINGCTSNAVIAADYTTGAPVAGVSVNFMDRGRNNKYTKTSLGTTDKSGILAYTAPESNSYWGNHLSFNYKNRTYKFNNDIRAYSYRPDEDEDEDEDNRYDVNILTDRNLYHPGDTISWVVAVAVKQPGKEPKVSASQKLTIKLQNTNYQNVESAELVTDALGRISGTFATQKGSLTGEYRILVQESESNQILSQSWVMVSDFKMPTFEAEFTSVERDVPSPGAVRLTGKARTYSGMPVAGAKVDVTVVGANRWRWFMPTGEKLAKLEATTGPDGVFTVDIPAEDLAKTNQSGKKFDSFQASAIVTSVTAETSECDKNFTTGKPYVLSADISRRIADSSEPLAISFAAYNADGDNRPIAINWQLLDKTGKTALAGDTKGGDTPKLNVSQLAAGEYTLRLAPADVALADTVGNAASIILYNVKRNQVPDGKKLFVPVDKYTVDGSKAEVLVGTSNKEIYVYPAIQIEDDLVALEPQKIGKGFKRMKFEFPPSNQSATVYLITVVDGDVLHSTVTLSRPEVKAPEIIAESFRDRLFPGASETWRFRLIDGKGKGMPDAAFVATMYNKALDQLRGGSFEALFRFFESGANISLDYKSMAWRNGSQNIPFRWANVPSYSWPVYLYWDYASYNKSLRIRGSRIMKAANMATAKTEAEAVSEEFEASDASLQEVVTVSYDSAPKQALTGSVAGIETEEDAEEEGNGGASAQEKFEYRASEVLQAFWRPNLVTDADGNVDIVFTVPNANTTWQLKATAWTEDLKTARFVAEAIANKPVMVQPNLPRFMRQGDTATVLATVYNNSTDTATVTTTIELFDVNTGKTTASAVITDDIAPNASAVVSMPLEAGVDASAIGYRVRSVSGNFADGEQAMIPVLSAASTVVESTEFYLNPNDKDPFSLTIKASDNASVTLQYCQNPIWTVVKAMRGIAGRNETTSTGLAGRLFSALAAKHIVEKNPAIAQAIRQWADNPDEEALVSMLEKNEDLKRLMLDQTPWVQAAASNTRRMAALAELLDPAKADATISSITVSLTKLQNTDGGFRWGSWGNESSEWSTRTVLTTLGIANSLGLLPDGADDLRKMIQPAFSYVEAEAVKPKRPDTDSDIALIATLFPTVKKSVAGDRLIRNTVGKIARNWRSDGTLGKAYDILILAGNGRKAEAAKVLASIREFGVVKPGMGLCFPSVNDIRGYATIIQAYKVMDASDAEIDAMRQWIIVQAQANDNLGAYNPDYIIASVLMTGSDWTSVATGQNVTVNGKNLDINKEESATGYFAQKLEGKGKFKITVTPNGVTPSYGSVVTIDRRPMVSVEARPGRDLAIEKRVLVERDGQWVETNDFALGERVRVQLTIVAKRNLEYISIDDERPACFEPVEQLPGYMWGGGLGFYRENLDASTRLFISYLPQGTYHLTYDMTANIAGAFISGIATLQSQYAPELTAHSAAARISVK